jgi:hypothetical protein
LRFRLVHGDLRIPQQVFGHPIVAGACHHDADARVDVQALAIDVDGLGEAFPQVSGERSRLAGVGDVAADDDELVATEPAYEVTAADRSGNV